MEPFAPLPYFLPAERNVYVMAETPVIMDGKVSLRMKDTDPEVLQFPDDLGVRYHLVCLPPDFFHVKKANFYFAYSHCYFGFCY